MHLSCELWVSKDNYAVGFCFTNCKPHISFFKLITYIEFINQGIAYFSLWYAIEWDMCIFFLLSYRVIFSTLLSKYVMELWPCSCLVQISLMDLIIIILNGTRIGLESHLLTYLTIAIQLMFHTVWTLTQITSLCMTTFIGIVIWLHHIRVMQMCI